MLCAGTGRRAAVSLHLYELYVEDECCERGYGLSCAMLTVAEAVRYEEAVLGSLLHELQTLRPTGYNTVERERGGLAALYGAVEERTVYEHALVVALHAVGGFRLAAVALLEHLILQTAGQCHHALFLGVVGKVLLTGLLHGLVLLGGGCSLPGAAKVLMPAEGYMGIVKFIFDVIVERGINACPPLLVGVGIAGSVEVAARLSKKALMRPVTSQNFNEIGADFEKMIEEGLNKINIGPGGLTGTKSVMGVNVEQAARHPSCLAVGVSTGCWGHRRATIRINADMSYEMISHKGMKL